MKALSIASKIFLNIFVIIYGITSVGSEIALANAGAITAFLGQIIDASTDDTKTQQTDLHIHFPPVSLCDIRTNVSVRKTLDFKTETVYHIAT